MKDKYPLPWDGMAITPADWDFLKAIIDEFDVRVVVEFGSGLSTLLLAEAGITVWSFDTDRDWQETVKAALVEEGNAGKASLKYWNGRHFPLPTVACAPDLVFVDGPRGGANREHAIQWAGRNCDLVVLHDAQREAETKWANKHLSPGFNRTRVGGAIHKGEKVSALWRKRASLWSNKSNVTE